MERNDGAYVLATDRLVSDLGHTRDDTNRSQREYTINKYRIHDNGKLQLGS